MCSELRSYEDFVRFCVNHQRTVCNFGALVLLMRRIWADDNTGWIMRISLADGVSPSLHWIFFFGVCFADRFGFGCPLFSPFTRYTAYARIRALRVHGCAEHSQCDCDRRYNFQRFHFHRLFLVIFRSQELRRMLDAANSKKI